MQGFRSKLRLQEIRKGRGETLFGVIDSGRHERKARTFACLSALVLVAVAPARAEFPPEGAVSDPNNPSIAAGDYPDAAHKTVMHHYIFYFDCGKRDWIGVSVAGTNGKPSAPPQAIGRGKEFPSGPPPGSKYVAGKPDRAINAGSGGTFALRQGVWFDLKTNEAMTSPKLCPGSAGEPDSVKRAKDTGQALPGTHAPATSEPVPPKADQLPPAPQYMPHQGNDRKL